MVDAMVYGVAMVDGPLRYRVLCSGCPAGGPILETSEDAAKAWNVEQQVVEGPLDLWKTLWPPSDGDLWDLLEHGWKLVRKKSTADVMAWHTIYGGMVGMVRWSDTELEGKPAAISAWVEGSNPVITPTIQEAMDLVVSKLKERGYTVLPPKFAP